MVSTLFDRNYELAQALSRQELLNRLGTRRASGTGTSDADLQREYATKATMEQLPAATLLDEEDKVQTAAKESLVDTGYTESTAQRIAESASSKQRNAVVSAGRQHPQGSRVVEVTGDAAVETGGRHKRQKVLRNPIDEDTGDARFPLQERSLVFHKNDPVRIFVHNPLSEGRASGTTTGTPGFWLYGFTGFLDQYPKNDDYLTGQSTIQMQCYDIRALMAKMRVSQNPVLPTVQPETLFKDRFNVFRDLIIPSRWGQAFANLSFENAMAVLTTGTNLERKGQGKKFGVGNLEVGKVVTYPAEGDDDPASDANRSILEAWHTLCVNGPGPINQESPIENAGILRDSDVLRIGRGTTTDGEFSPFNSYVHFLLPRDGTGARTLTQVSFDAGTEQREFVTRFEIITDFCARLDYEMHVLGNGDVVFEFPMYDFLPKDYGDWRGVFEANFHLISGEVSDEGGDIVTALAVSGGVPNADIDALSNAPKGLIPRGLIQSSVMAARVGVTFETHSIPFMRDGPRLRSLGLIEFQKRLANANTMSMEFGFRPFMTPNRPVWNAVEQRMGLISSVTDTITLFQTAQTAPALRYIRTVRDDGTFRFITGGASMPISYREVFPGNKKSVGNSTVGVRVYPEFDGDDDAFTDNSSVTTNDDRPPDFVKERRPGTFFTLAPKVRRIAESIAQFIDEEDRDFILNHIPQSDGTTFAIRARNHEGRRIFSAKDRAKIAAIAKDNAYILVDTRQRFIFEPRRPGQPDFIERTE